jgi:acyl-coenzyme A synthetase/AMP-(fatty) acid ligase/acyl carrier protein
LLQDILPGKGQFPDEPPAIIGGSGTWSYEQITDRTNAIAAELLLKLGERAAVIGVLMTDPAHRMIALLGIWRAGMTAVLIEPDMPRSRLESDARHAGIELFISDAVTSQAVTTPGTASIEFSTIGDNSETSDPASVSDENRAALLIYIPDPTGAPRAVIRTHRDILSDMQAVDRFYVTDEAIPARVAAPVLPMHGLIHALSALRHGGTLYPYSEFSGPPTTNFGQVQRRGITLLTISTTKFRQLLNSDGAGQALPDCKWVVVYGDKLLKGDVEAFQNTFNNNCKMLNCFGTYETGLVAYHVLDHSSPVPDLIPVGQPVAGRSVRILNRDGLELPPGKRGEIAVLGAKMPPGFWNDDSASSAAYSSVPEDPGRRLYLSGDMGYIRDDLLFVLGRADSQVKIQGRRVDLGEVEHTMNRLEGVQNTSVMVSESSAGHRELTAYVTPSPGGALNESDLRERLAADLPGFKIPENIVAIGAVQTLPSSEGDLHSGVSAIDAEQTMISATEESVAEVWKEVFELDSVEVTDDLLDLGIGSLHAMVMCQKLCQIFSIDIPYSQLVISPTVRELSTFIDERNSGAPA